MLKTLNDPATEVEPVATLTARRRPQFSLLTLTLLIVIAGGGTLLYLNHAEVRELRAENSNLRNELGILDVKDPDKLHAVARKNQGDYQWSWRVHLPPGRSFMICSALQGIPADGLPAKYSWEGLRDESGTVDVDAAFRKDINGKP